MDVFPKFIIEGNSLILSKVTYHHQLVTNKENVKGGGWFKYGKEASHLILYGDSLDFGKAKIEDIKHCIENGEVYSSATKHRMIAYDFKYSYDTGTEIISLTQNNLIPKHIQEQIEKETLALTAKSRSNNDYQSGYNQGIELGYEKGATAYASKLLQAEDMMHKIVGHLKAICELPGPANGEENAAFDYAKGIAATGCEMFNTYKKLNDNGTE